MHHANPATANIIANQSQDYIDEKLAEFQEQIHRLQGKPMRGCAARIIDHRDCEENRNKRVGGSVLPYTKMGEANQKIPANRDSEALKID